MFFDNAGDPLIFKLESRSFYCDFVLATLAPEAEEVVIQGFSFFLSLEGKTGEILNSFP